MLSTDRNTVLGVPYWLVSYKDWKSLVQEFEDRSRFGLRGDDKILKGCVLIRIQFVVGISEAILIDHCIFVHVGKEDPMSIFSEECMDTFSLKSWLSSAMDEEWIGDTSGKSVWKNILFLEESNVHALLPTL